MKRYAKRGSHKAGRVSFISFLRPLRRVAEDRFENSLGSEETQACFQMIMSYCCDIFKAKDMLAVLYGADRSHHCLRFPKTNVDMVMGRETSSLVV